MPDSSTPENPLGFRNIKLFCIDAPDLGGPCAFLTLHSPSVTFTPRDQALMQLRERGPSYPSPALSPQQPGYSESPPPPPSLTSPPPPVARLQFMGGCTRWVRGSSVPVIALSRLGCTAPPPPPSIGGVYPPSPSLTSPPPPVGPASGVGGGLLVRLACHWGMDQIHPRLPIQRGSCDPVSRRCPNR